MPLAASIEAGGTTSVVTLRGAVDDALLQRCGRELRDAARASRVLVLDLDEVTLLSPEPLRALLDEVEQRGAAVELVCSRSTGRRLLECWGLAARATVRSSLRDAGRERPVRPPIAHGAPEELRSA